VVGNLTGNERNFVGFTVDRIATQTAAPDTSAPGTSAHLVVQKLRGDSLGQDELSLTGSAKPVEFAIVFDPEFVSATA
jgi:hypothetical protein